MALLTYINHVAPSALEIGSDGKDTPDMFTEGTDLARWFGKDITIRQLFT